MAEDDSNEQGGTGQSPHNPLGAPGSAADDEKALKKGRGRMIAGMVVAGIAAIGALAFYMSPGQDEAYSEFGKNINERDQKYFDGFWGCAFPGFDLERIENNADLRAQIHGRASGHGARYGAHVRDDCMPKLQELEPELKSLIPPEDMKQPVRDLADAVSRLRSAWSNFVAYLDGLEDEDKSYDEQKAMEYINKIAKAWYDYKVTISKLNDNLEKALGKS